MMTVVVVVMVLAPLVTAGIVLVVVLSLTGRGRPEQPGWQPMSPGASLTPGGRGAWNAQIMGKGLIGAMGGTLNAGFGRFMLEDGHLSYVPDGAAHAQWRVSCRDLSVSHRGVLSAASVELVGPMGTVRCDVSTEHINRFTRNSAKSLREAGHARSFVQALAANGAHVR